jgi:hypothetical protein
MLQTALPVLEDIIAPMAPSPRFLARLPRIVHQVPRALRSVPLGSTAHRALKTQFTALRLITASQVRLPPHYAPWALIVKPEVHGRPIAQPVPMHRQTPAIPVVLRETQHASRALRALTQLVSMGWNACHAQLATYVWVLHPVPPRLTA